MSEQPSESVAVEGLCHGFGKRKVLDGVSLTVPTGSVFALMGQNGEGKTTLVRCLLGQLRPWSGRIRILGRDPWRHRPVLMEEVGVVPDVVDARLHRFGIGHDRRVANLSRGEKAQLLLAIALAAEPRLLVLDDPTLGLDALARRDLQQELVGELVERGTTVFLTSHDLDGVERLADRVAILAGGRIVAGGVTEELKRDWSERLGRPVSLEEVFIGAVSRGEAA